MKRVTPRPLDRYHRGTVELRPAVDGGYCVGCVCEIEPDTALVRLLFRNNGQDRDLMYHLSCWQQLCELGGP